MMDPVSKQRKIEKSSFDPSSSASDNVKQEKEERNTLKQYPVAPNPIDECYKKHENMGRAIIFNHENFYPRLNLKTRSGTNHDGIILKQILENLGFSVSVYKDYCYHQIQMKLEEIVSEDHTQSECLLIAVMTHGKNGMLYAKDQEYPTETLWNPFSPDLCPTLAGKPKIFFIQACRGNETDRGTTVSFQQTDNPTEEISQSSYTIPLMADFLFFYATFQGYVAWRYDKNGSPFITSLVKQLGISYQTKDILSILTDVNKEVAITFESINDEEDMNKKKQMCTIVSTLTRKFYF